MNMYSYIKQSTILCFIILLKYQILLILILKNICLQQKQNLYIYLQLSNITPIFTNIELIDNIVFFFLLLIYNIFW